MQILNEDHLELTDFQKKQLIRFVDEVNRLNIRTSNENIFMKEFMQHINDLDSFYNYKSPWILESGDTFKALPEAQQTETLAIIKPILVIAKKYLATITNYDDLMQHVLEHRELIAMFCEAVEAGGHLSISRRFFNEFRPKIGDQWFGLAHLVCYYETVKKCN